MGRVHPEGGCCRKTTGFCNGAILEDKGLLAVRVSLSSEELTVNWHLTGLQCDWLTPVLCGVAGLKETFHHLRHGVILEVLLSGVGMLKILHLLMQVYS